MQQKMFLIKNFKTRNFLNESYETRFDWEGKKKPTKVMNCTKTENFKVYNENKFIILVKIFNSFILKFIFFISMRF